LFRKKAEVAREREWRIRNWACGWKLYRRSGVEGLANK